MLQKPVHTRPRARWYHWPVAGLALLWSLVSAADYVLTKLQIAAYVAAFTPDQLAYFTALPVWISIGWAVGVWAGLAGAMLLFARARSAAAMFALSFGGLMTATVGLVYLTEPPMQAVTGRIGIWVMLAALGVALLLFVYARAMNVRLRQG